MSKQAQKVESCTCTVIHQDIVQDAYDKMLPSDTVTSLAELFKIFGDPTRIRLLYDLKCSEMCVCDLAA